MKLSINKIIYVLFGIVLTATLNAEEGIKPLHATYYLTGGMIQCPGDMSTTLPSIGLGAHLQRGCMGMDISAGAASLFVCNYFSTKSIFLLHPGPLYLGCGPGWGRSVNVALMGSPPGGRTSKTDTLNLEWVVGYEFRNNITFKTFTQVSVTQPLAYLRGRSSGRKPAVQIVGGVGF